MEGFGLKMGMLGDICAGLIDGMGMDMKVCMVPTESVSSPLIPISLISYLSI